ncbi:MAG: hypothetical protein LBI27_00270 [Clostridiales bacterium]|jgi:hypothetical protein|nr:hypothetical protein [Clostridiales bacterium]
MKYIKFKILVIILLLFAVLAVAVYFFSPRNEEREMNGMFVRGANGYLHQAEEEGATVKQA